MYIRTKDNIYEVTKDTKGTEFIVVGKNKTLLDYGTFVNSEADIISQSENLEELCDKFVVIDKETKEVMNIIAFLEYAKHWVSWKYNIYGAIWTDEGLIYIAKMNDKGELELI